MALNVGRIEAQVSADLSQFTKAMGQVQKVLKQMGANFNTEFNKGSNATQKLNKRLEEMHKHLKDVDRIVSGIIIAQVFYSAVNAIQNATSSVIQFKGEMEKAQIAMEYFLGSTERAEAFIYNMKDFAAVTAFSTEQALMLSRKLMGAQFRPEELRSVMEILNDASAATGASAEQLDRIVLAITQMRTNGRIMGQELRQLAEAGIPIYRILQEELGLTAEQMARIGDLKIEGDIGVAAVLKGLQRRYEGAAERIAMTIPGLTETIKDNLLFIVSDAIEAPYESMRQTLTKWRNLLEDMRYTMMESGLGGVFEKFVPEHLHTSIRALIASLIELKNAFGRLFSALKPVFALLTDATIKVFGAVIPVLTFVVDVISRMIQHAMQAHPAIKLLITAMAGLMIAGTVARTLMFLYAALRLNTIAAAVAWAFNMLSRALGALALVLSKNPITALIMIAAAALAYLALNSKIASEWLDHLTAKLSKLAGINIDDILQPTDGKAIEEWYEQFNEQFDRMNDDLRSVGQNAEKAGKKVNDKFVASFDELYLIPDKLDDLNDELDLPALDDLPEVTIPKLTDNLINPGTSPGGNGFDWDIPFMPPAKVDKPKDGDGGSDGINKGVDAVTVALANLKEALKNAQEKAKEFKAQAGAAISSWAIESKTVLEGWAVNTSASLSNWLAEVQAQFEATMPELEVVTETSFEGINDTLTVFGDNLVATSVTMTTVVAAMVASWQSMLQNMNMATAVELPAIKALWAMFLANLSTETETFKTNLLTTWQNMGLDLETSTSAISTINSLLWSVFTAGLGSLTAALKDSVTTTWEDMKVNVTTITEGLSTSVTTAWQAMLDAVTLSSFKTLLSDMPLMWEMDRVLVEGTVESLVSNVLATFASLPLTLPSIVAQIPPIFEGIKPAIQSVFENLGQSAIDSIHSAAQGIAVVIAGLAASLSALTGKTYNINTNIPKPSLNTGASKAPAAAPAGAPTVTEQQAKELKDKIFWSSKAIEEASKNVPATQPSAAPATSSPWDVFKNISLEDMLPKYTFSDIKDVIEQEAAKPQNQAGLTLMSIFAGGGAALKGLGTALKYWDDVVAGLKSGLSALPGFATGAVIDREMFARVGERNKREAIIPLENSSYMRPFSAAVANDLFDMLYEAGLGGYQQSSRVDDRPILYVGTLIADDRSLKELYRKMEVIEMNERQRKGLT